MFIVLSVIVTAVKVGLLGASVAVISCHCLVAVSGPHLFTINQSCLCCFSMLFVKLSNWGEFIVLDRLREMSMKG